MAIVEGGFVEQYTETEVLYQSHGTGDLFDAVLAGAILKGATLKEAAFQAHNFVAACLAGKGGASRKRKRRPAVRAAFGKTCII